MNLVEILKESADKFSGKPAFTMKMDFRSKTFTFNEVLKLSRQFALYLNEKKITKDDKVIICAPNSPYWICSFWGCIIQQVIVIPLNIQSSKEMIEGVIRETKAKLLIKHQFFRYQLEDSIEQLKIENFEELLKETDESGFSADRIPRDKIMEILYTSGTTGKPKGVILTHQNLLSNLDAVDNIMTTSFKNAKMLSVLPLSHIYEQNLGFLFPIRKGIHVIYVHSFTEIRNLMKKHKITLIIAVPEFLQLLMSRIEARFESKSHRFIFDNLLKLSEKVKNKTFSKLIFFPVHMELGGKLNTVASGGASLDIELEKKWVALGIDILQGYGLTETSPVVAMNRKDEKKAGSVGKIIPGVEVKIAEDKEILVRGPNVFSGYYKDEEKTKEAFTEDGWFKTGDLGEFDQDGFLFLKGRKKYLILGPGGQNVYPEDIENVLIQIPGVEDSCVLGLEDPQGRVKIHAVLLVDALKIKEEERIIAKANEKLASYQHISEWTIWPEEDFPRTVTRKIKREEVLKYIKGKEIEKVDKEKKGKLIWILSRLSGINKDKIHAESKVIDDLNLDSLTRVELLVWIEEDFNIVIPESELTKETTVADLEDLIRKRTLPPESIKLRKWTRNKWLLPVKWVGSVFFLLFGKIFIILKVKGEENLNDLPLPAIFMANHTSFLDSLAIYMALPSHIRKRVSFAAARDVLYEQFKAISIVIEIIFNSFPIQRGKQQNIRKGMELMGEMLDEGYSVIVYPEGRMSRTGLLQDLKRGAGVAAMEMDAWIMPVKVKGTNQIVPFDKYFPQRRGTVEITFGKRLKFKRTDENTEVIKGIKNELELL